MSVMAMSWCAVCGLANHGGGMANCIAGLRAEVGRQGGLVNTMVDEAERLRTIVKTMSAEIDILKADCARHEAGREEAKAEKAEALVALAAALAEVERLRAALKLRHMADFDTVSIYERHRDKYPCKNCRDIEPAHHIGAATEKTETGRSSFPTRDCCLREVDEVHPCSGDTDLCAHCIEHIVADQKQSKAAAAQGAAFPTFEEWHDTLGNCVHFNDENKYQPEEVRTCEEVYETENAAAASGPREGVLPDSEREEVSTPANEGSAKAARPEPSQQRQPPILPCPFCGDADDMELTESVPKIGGALKQAVYCNSCFCEGPPADDDNAAIAAWNCRTLSQQKQPQPDSCANNRHVVQGAWGSDRTTCPCGLASYAPPKKPSGEPCSTCGVPADAAGQWRCRCTGRCGRSCPLPEGHDGSCAIGAQPVMCVHGTPLRDYCYECAGPDAQRAKVGHFHQTPMGQWFAVDGLRSQCGRPTCREMGDGPVEQAGSGAPCSTCGVPADAAGLWHCRCTGAPDEVAVALREARKSFEEGDDTRALSSLLCAVETLAGRRP